MRSMKIHNNLLLSFFDSFFFTEIGNVHKYNTRATATLVDSEY